MNFIMKYIKIYISYHEYFYPAIKRNFIYYIFFHIIVISINFVKKLSAFYHSYRPYIFSPMKLCNTLMFRTFHVPIG